MRKLRLLVACLGMCIASTVGLIGVSPAGAATRPPMNVYMGHFQCSPPGYAWVKQYWPDMTSAKGGTENTYFGAELQYWDPSGATWRNLSWSGWYAGASNANGRIAVANGAYFSYLNGNIPYPMDGILWSPVTRGFYYRTIEYYSWPSVSVTTSGAISWVGTHSGPTGGTQYCYVS